MRRLIVVVLAVYGLAVPATPSHADEVQMYECTAQKRLAGREDAAADAPQAQSTVTGELRYMEKGDPGYVGVVKGKSLPEWLELYGALQGHGSSFLGFYLAKDFKCEKVEG